MRLLEKQLLLQTIGVNPSNYASIDEIHLELDKLIAEHVNPFQNLMNPQVTEDLVERDGVTGSNKVNNGFKGLIKKFKKSVRMRGLLPSLQIAASFLSFKFKQKVARFRKAENNNYPQLSNYIEKQKQGPWFRLSSFPESTMEFIEYPPKLSDPKAKDIHITLVCTVLNEAIGIKDWLESLNSQRIKPSEVIIIDGGSSDATVAEIQSLLDKLNFKITLEVVPNANPACGRNSALKLVSELSDLVIFIDAGCAYGKDFIDYFKQSYSFNPEPEAFAGTWVAKSDNHRLGRRLTPDWKNWHKSDWNKYLPSARAFGMNKAALDLGILFPEWLTMSGEDTAFMVECKQKIRNWKILTTPMVDWIAPASSEKLLSVEKRYAVGDGESGVMDYRFNQLLSVKTRRLKHFREGFLEGFNKRPKCDLKRGVKNVFVICSLTPLADSGGAQRTTQIAYELLRDPENRVMFLSAEKSFESPDTIISLASDLTRLTLGFPEDIKIARQIKDYLEIDLAVNVLIEAPHPNFLVLQEELLKLKSNQLKFTYTEIDDWDGPLGGSWYENETRLKIASNSHYLSASAKTLSDRLNAETGRSVTYIPNAADPTLFKISDKKSEAGFDVTYAGGLWGTWFDWQSTLEACENLPNLSFVLLGDMDLWRRSLLQARFDNLTMPGIVNQTELPAIYSQSQVLIVPFIVNEITKATNPLKIHEYLLMDKAIVLSEMPEFENFEGCSHLFYYGEKSKCSMSEAILKALAWDGQCPQSKSGQKGLHEGVFTWERVVQLYASQKGV